MQIYEQSNKNLSHCNLKFPAKVKAMLCLFASVLIKKKKKNDQKVETIGGSAVQEVLFSRASWMGFVIPTLARVYEVASGKSLNTWKSHFLSCKINRIYQDELFLSFRIIIYVNYVCVHI